MSSSVLNRCSAALLSCMLVRVNPEDDRQSIIPFYTLDVNKRKVEKSRFTCLAEGTNICLKIGQWLQDSQYVQIGNFIKSKRLHVALIAVVPLKENDPVIFELRNALTGARHPSLGGTHLTKEALIQGVKRFNDARWLNDEESPGPSIVQELTNLNDDDIPTIGAKAYHHINKYFPTELKETFAFVRGMLREDIANKTVKDSIDELLNLAENAVNNKEAPDAEQARSILRFFHLNCSAFLGLAIVVVDGSHRITALTHLLCGQYPGDNEKMQDQYTRYSLECGQPIVDIPTTVYFPEVLSVEGIDDLRYLSGQSQSDHSKSQRIDFFNLSSDFLTFIGSQLNSDLQEQITRMTTEERMNHFDKHMKQIADCIMQWIDRVRVGK